MKCGSLLPQTAARQAISVAQVVLVRVLISRSVPTRSVYQATAGLDIDNLEMLTNLETGLKAEGIELLLANERDMLQHSGFADIIGKQHTYLTVESASLTRRTEKDTI